MIPCDILKVKNALVKFVYRVTESAICGLVLSFFPFRCLSMWPKLCFLLTGMFLLTYRLCRAVRSRLQEETSLVEVLKISVY